MQKQIDSARHAELEIVDVKFKQSKTTLHNSSTK